jgi:hypothetical protein
VVWSSRFSELGEDTHHAGRSRRAQTLCIKPSKSAHCPFYLSLFCTIRRMSGDGIMFEKIFFSCFLIWPHPGCDSTSNRLFVFTSRIKLFC